ncbi:MAG: TonB-dependent receptor [Sporomusa sp.]|jgi:vitamin B12 transporter|nr:TonB-dependent receptor [Sporomusa sp.]
MKKRQKQLLCSLLSSALLFGIPQASLAEEQGNQDYALDEYVVTANRIPVKKTEIAANVTVISREEIEKGGFSSIPDVLKKGNITLEKKGGATVPVLNGDDRVLILVDGRRMSWAHLVVSGSDHTGQALDQLPVENIERIEIVRGPASSLYGSDAVGGVINIITRKAVSTQTSVASEFGSWGFRRYNLTTQGKSADIGFLVTAEKKKQDSFKYQDAKTGQTKTHPDTQTDQDFLTMRLDKELGEGRSLSLQLEHTKEDSGFGGYINQNGTVQYPGGYRTSQTDNVALTYQWGKDAGANNLFRIYHNQFETTYAKSLTSHDELEANGLDWQQSWKLNNKHTLVSGSEWRQEHLDDDATIDKTFTTHALFAEDRWKLDDKWTISAGTRYDGHSEFSGKLTSRVTANREINPTTNIYASWGQYLKNPTIAQMYTNTEFMKPSPNLTPESGQTVTVGFNTELVDGTKLQTSVFRSQIKDAIDWAWKDWNGTGSGTEFTKYYNVDKQKRQGLDISLSRQLSPQWNVSAGYTYVKIKNKSNTETSYSADLSNSQPNGYRLNVEYDQDKFNTGLTLRSATGRDVSERFTSKSYLTLDMVMNYKISPDTKIYVKGYNLTNEAYELAASYWTYPALAPGQFPMQGRSFYVGIQQKI